MACCCPPSSVLRMPIARALNLVLFMCCRPNLTVQLFLRKLLLCLSVFSWFKDPLVPLEKHNSPFWWKQHSSGWVLLPWLKNFKGNVNCFSSGIVGKRHQSSSERWTLMLIRERSICASLWEVSSTQSKFRSGMEISQWFASSLLLFGDGGADWHLRAVLTSALLCHSLWASLVCCLCCFSLLRQVASCNGNEKGRGKERFLRNALVTGVMKDMGMVLTHLHSLEMLWMEQHNQI